MFSLGQLTIYGVRHASHHEHILSCFSIQQVDLIGSLRMVPNQGNLSEQGYTLIKSFRGKVTQDGRAVGLRQHPSHGLVVTKTIDEHSTEAENEDEVPNEVRVLKSLPPHHRIVKLIAELPDSPYQGAFTSVLGFCNGGDVRELELYARATGNQMPEPWF